MPGVPCRGGGGRGGDAIRIECLGKTTPFGIIFRSKAKLGGGGRAGTSGAAPWTTSTVGLKRTLGKPAAPLDCPTAEETAASAV